MRRSIYGQFIYMCIFKCQIGIYVVCVEHTLHMLIVGNVTRVAKKGMPIKTFYTYIYILAKYLFEILQFVQRILKNIFQFFITILTTKTAMNCVVLLYILLHMLLCIGFLIEHTF